MNDIKKILSNTAPSVTYKQAYNTFDLVPILMSMNISLGYEQDSNEKEAIHAGRRNGYMCVQRRSGTKVSKNVH